jgi:hypothetical protein
MIFIGPKLNEPDAHFVTNIIACIGTGHDLIIDLKVIRDKELIFRLIQSHLQKHAERYVIYNAYEDEDFFIDFKRHFPSLILFTFFSDDEWRHANYDRYLALYSDFFSITSYISHLELYFSYGLSNGMVCQWACNPQYFYPLDEDKQYDVTFIGAPHGKRFEYVQFLAENGVDIRVFGKGWGKYPDLKKHWGGYLTAANMLKVISQSRINLNFLWTSRDPHRTTIKGRTMEIPACRAFQLSSHTDEFVNYGFKDGLNIATFRDKQEMLAKVRYYLRHEKERETVADNAYKFALNNHTCTQRFADMFEHIEEGKQKNSVPKLNILVVLKKPVVHSITTDDSRMEISIRKVKDCAVADFVKYDGIIFLCHDSTINNETLYMMAFARHCDNSDVVLANFYTRSGKENIWIRFWDKIIESHRKIIRFFPQEAICFSPQMAKSFVIKQVPWDKVNLSFIEYPSFNVSEMGVFRKRLLKWCFGKYDHKVMFQKSLKRRRFVKALNVGLDHLVQREIRKRAI